MRPPFEPPVHEPFCESEPGRILRESRIKISKIMESVFDVRCQHGESPVWDAGGGCLYWVDLLRAFFIKGISKRGRARVMTRVVLSEYWPSGNRADLLWPRERALGFGRKLSRSCKFFTRCKTPTAHDSTTERLTPKADFLPAPWHTAETVPLEFCIGLTKIFAFAKWKNRS